MINIDWSTVTEAAGGNRPPAGGYVLTIVAAQDVQEKEYLKISYDYAEGQYKGYWDTMYNSYGWHYPVFIRSYSVKARGFFKRFLATLQRENPNFNYQAWTDAGASMVGLMGLKFGAVIGEEEYRNQNGEVKVRQVIQEILPVAAIREKKYQVKPLKKLDDSSSQKPPAAPKPAAASHVSSRNNAQDPMQQFQFDEKVPF